MPGSPDPFHKNRRQALYTPGMILHHPCSVKIQAGSGPMKILLPSLIALTLLACSSGYTPSERMLELKKNMTTEQAIAILQKKIWGDKKSPGICGARGFWYDENADFIVQADGISLLSHKRGKLLRKHQRTVGEVMVFEKQYYRYDFYFDRIQQINIYDDHRLLPAFPYCNRKTPDKKYRILDLYGDDLNSLKFTVAEEDFDKTMAALSLVFANVPVQLK
jgi:hypothetical protein